MVWIYTNLREIFEMEFIFVMFRTIGFGSLSVMARVGAMVGPQLVYLVNIYYICIHSGNISQFYNNTWFKLNMHSNITTEVKRPQWLLKKHYK